MVGHVSPRQRCQGVLSNGNITNDEFKDVGVSICAVIEGWGWENEKAGMCVCAMPVQKDPVGCGTILSFVWLVRVCPRCAAALPTVMYACYTRRGKECRHAHNSRHTRCGRYVTRSGHIQSYGTSARSARCRARRARRQRCCVECSAP